MKIIVTHTSPDWDAISSVWILKKYMAGWQDAQVQFVPAGQRLPQSKFKMQQDSDNRQVTDIIIETIGENEYIHVDTGLGPLDHHQNNDLKVCAVSKCWDYVQEKTVGRENQFTKEHKAAVDRLVKILVDIDHFREVYWCDPIADYHEFSLIGTLDGLKLAKPEQDDSYVAFGLQCLDAMVHEFENRIWAEKDIAETGIPFTTRWGKAMGFQTINDAVLKLAQKMGYAVVVRKDPRKGYVRIKALPPKVVNGEIRDDIDLTLVYEKFKKIDPDATWFLHVSKKMLLNGTPKNPAMVPTKLSLQELIHILETV